MDDRRAALAAFVYELAAWIADPLAPEPPKTLVSKAIVLLSTPGGEAPREEPPTITPEGSRVVGPEAMRRMVKSALPSAPTPTTPPDALAEIEWAYREIEGWLGVPPDRAKRYLRQAIAALRAERTEHEARLARHRDDGAALDLCRKRADMIEAKLRAAQEKIEKALRAIEPIVGISEAVRKNLQRILRGEGRPQERSSE